MNPKPARHTTHAPGDSPGLPWAVMLACALFVILFPIFVMFKFSVADRDSSYGRGGQGPPLLPGRVQFEQYASLLERDDFIRAAACSLGICLLAVTLSLALGAPAAYALARTRIPGLTVLMAFILAVRLFPDICSVVPVAQVFSHRPLSAVPPLVRVALAHSLLALPYVVTICMGVFRTIPRDLEEQAGILGAGPWYTFRHVVLPVSITGLAAAAIYVFLLSWNEFIFAYFLFADSADVSLPVYLLRILAWTPQLNLLAALSVMLSIPVIIFCFAVQRYMIAGMTAGAVKE